MSTAHPASPRTLVQSARQMTSRAQSEAVSARACYARGGCGRYKGPAGVRESRKGRHGGLLGGYLREQSVGWSGGRSGGHRLVDRSVISEKPTS